MTNQHKINVLLSKLEFLSQKQDEFAKEIQNLRLEINKLRNEVTAENETPVTPTFQNQTPPTPVQAEIVQDQKEKPVFTYPQPEPKHVSVPPAISVPSDVKPAAPRKKSDLEKFIGENLINKIGIAITVLGVGIGAKYAIDHELINPLTRIILGYLVGIGLLGFAFKLKKQYENFSAVLLSGAMAILYFITFAAYSFYELMPQGATFALMVAFTAFTVFAAIQYNKQVIAHIGLVGAYGVPFLLSDGSGRVEILFSYMAIINVGILILAFKKYWKILYFVSFGLTWLIYMAWYILDADLSTQFAISYVFLSIFFILFYVTLLAYKLIRGEKYNEGDIILLLLNAFIYYGFGYHIFESHPVGKHALGIFTLLNALLHFIACVTIYKRKLADSTLLHLVSGLVLTFITMAVPVQLDGNWVTMLWTGEAVLLFWIGRTKGSSIYEKLSYPLMLLASFSLIHDWITMTEQYVSEAPETYVVPILNVYFLTSALFVAGFTAIHLLNQNKRFKTAFTNYKELADAISVIIPVILISSVYFTFQVEISTYWNQLIKDAWVMIPQEGEEGEIYFFNNDLDYFKTIWTINYMLVFISALSFLNITKLKNRLLGYGSLVLFIITFTVFLTEGLLALSDLRESYIEQPNAQYFQHGIMNLVVRYISIICFGLGLFASSKAIRQAYIQINLAIPFQMLLHTCILWVASSELIHWMDLAHSTQSYKLGLSILWGVYSLFLITLGIWKKNKPVRIGAIALFGVTLIKLFFYDISNLDTIAKTIVFVSLGVLLLIISFLYNKYKHIISDETES